MELLTKRRLAMSISRLKLFKRSNGRWYILFEEEGRQRWKSTGAIRKRVALQALREFKDTHSKRPQPVLFTQFSTHFMLAQAHPLRESTLRRFYKPAFEAFLAACGNKVLDAYGLTDVEKFKRTILERASATYANILFRSLRSAFNLAVKWQMTSQNPFSRSTPVKIPEQTPAHFTREQFVQFLKEVSEPFLRDLYAFAALTGLRQGELLSLNWKSIDLDRGLLTVESAGRFLTKTGKLRTIPLSGSALALLKRRYLVAHASGFVFHRNGLPLAQSYVEHKFKKAIREMKLDERLKFHSLRHTFATWLVQEGVSIYEVQKLLGHSSVAVTEVYSHLAASELHRAVNKINLQLN
jgi:integrase